MLKNIQLTGSLERLLVILLLGVFLVQGGAALVHMSATGDETHYLGMGRYLIKHQRWDLDDALLQPPLSYYLHSIPLLPLSLEDRLFSIPDINARGRAIMESHPDDIVLMLARVPILFLAAGLGLMVFFWGRQAYGSAGGLLALFLYTFHPVLIGNAVLITPDLCLTFFSTLTLYLLWRYRASPRWTHCAGVGGALGLALLSKYSAVLVAAAISIIVLALPAIRRFRPATDSWGWRFRHLALILATAVLAVNAGYMFQGTLAQLEGMNFRSSLFQSLGRINVIRDLPLPIPQPYVLGLDVQHSVIEDGFISYMLGEKAERGWFHYYIVAFFLKSPIPFLLLIILAGWKGRDRLHWIILVTLIIFPLYFGAFRLSRGVRYILPVYPLLCVWTSQIALQLRERTLSRKLRWGILFLLVWYAAGTLYIAPHYMAYFNEIAGGPNNGINLLFESDFDWGQELKGLDAYLKNKNIDRIKLGCFSTADPAHYGIRFEPLPCETPAKRETGLIAASATALQTWGCYDWLKEYKPVDRVGYTIFIYNIPSANEGR